MVTWQLQDAKNRLSAVVDAAIVAAEDYERFRRLAKSALPSFNELLLQMPQDDGEFVRLPLQPRLFDA